MSSLKNELKLEGFSLENWTRALRKEFFSMTIEPVNHPKLRTSQKKERELVIAISENIDPVVGKALGKEHLALQYQNLITEGEWKRRRGRKKGKGRKSPSTRFLELIVIGAEQAKNDPKLLFEIQRILALPGDKESTIEQESMSKWISELNEAERATLPSFRSAKTPKMGNTTSWINGTKRSAWNKIIQRYASDKMFPRISEENEFKTKRKIWDHIVRYRHPTLTNKSI